MRSRNTWIVGIAVLLCVGVGLSVSALTPVDPIQFVIPAASWDPVRNESGKMLTRNWEELGLTVELIELDYAGSAERLGKPPFDDYSAWVFGFVSRPERLDPDVLLYWPFHSSNIGEDGTNYAAFSSAYYDELVTAQRTEMDIEKRRELVWQCQEYINQEVPAKPLYHVVSAVGHGIGRFEGWTSMVGYNLWHVWNLLNLRPLTDDKTVRFARHNDIGTSNPMNFMAGLNPDLMRLVYDTLTRIGTDGKPVSSAAESWEAEDETTILVRLRPNMFFHDGMPVTAHDVKFSYEFMTEWEQPELSPFTKAFEEIEVVDSLTLRMKLKDPYPGVYQTTFAQVYILPWHIWKDVLSFEGVTTPYEWENPDPVGSGPFKWGYWKREQELFLEANENHYQPPQVNFLFINLQNPEVIFQALMAGDIDFHERRLLPEQIEEAKGNLNIELSILEDFGVYYMGWNTRILPGRDSLFRKALAYTFDYDFIVDVILKGWAVAGQSFIAPANEFWNNPNLVIPPFDLDKARELLEGAGYQWDNKGKLCYPEVWENSEERFKDAPEWPGQPG